MMDDQVIEERLRRVVQDDWSGDSQEALDALLTELKRLRSGLTSTTERLVKMHLGPNWQPEIHGSFTCPICADIDTGRHSLQENALQENEEVLSEQTGT